MSTPQVQRMTKTERTIYEGNLKLLDEKNEMLRDIEVLIRYIRGNRDLKGEVIKIMRYYKSKSSMKGGRE